MSESTNTSEHGRLKAFKQLVRPAFDKASWPVSTEEEWRRSDISLFDLDALALPGQELLENTGAEVKAGSLVSLNEVLSMTGEASLSSAVLDRVFSYLENLRDNSANRLVLWNLLFSEDIFILHIPTDQKDEELHELCWHSLGEEVSRHTTLIVMADDLSSARLLLRLKGMEGHVQNFVAHYVVGNGSSLDVSVLQESSDEVLSFYQASATMGRDAHFIHFEGILGGGYVKNRVEVELMGGGGDLNLRGLYFADNEQHIDMRTIQHHSAEHADSRTFYKGVIKDEAQTIFQGLIEVAHKARGTDAYLTNNNLLLNDGAKSDSIPSLNIKTDDVKCSHGSTTGKLNEEQIYYFQCRGFPRQDAKELLILGYFEELISGLPQKAQTETRQRVQKRLRGEDRLAENVVESAGVARV